MAVQCLFHARWHRNETGLLACLRTIAMLLPMPRVCEFVARCTVGEPVWLAIIGYALAMHVAMLASNAAIDGVQTGLQCGCDVTRRAERSRVSRANSDRQIRGAPRV